MSILTLSPKERTLSKFEDVVKISLQYFNSFDKDTMLKINSTPFYFTTVKTNTIEIKTFTYGGQQVRYEVLKNSSNDYEIRMFNTAKTHYTMMISNLRPDSVILYDKDGEKVITDREAFNEIDIFQYTCGDAVFPVDTDLMCKVKDKLLEIENEIKEHY